MSKPSGRVLLSLLLLAVVLAVPAEAADRWKVRGFGAWLSSGGESVVVAPPAGSCLQFGNCYGIDPRSGSGYGLSVEFRVTRHLFGVEFGALQSSLDTDIDLFFAREDPILGGVVFDQVKVTIDAELSSVYIGGNFHFWKPGSRLDVFAGPFYAAVDYGDGSFSAFGRPLGYDYDSDGGVGLNFGFDVNFGKRWFVGAGLRYLAVGTTLTVIDEQGQTLIREAVDVDPFILSVGGGARF